MEAAGAAAEPREIAVPAMEYPWSAVGRLNVAGRSYCSAVLISDRYILSAAHCLWFEPEKRWWPAGSVHFVPGFQGDAVISATLKSYVVADGYRFDRHGLPADEAKDWVVAELDEPLGGQVGWLASGALDGGPLLGHAGYRQDHRYRVNLDYGCRVLAQPPANPLLWESCEALSGSSGGPLLAFLPDGPRVVGIVVASTSGKGGGMTAVVPLSSMFDSQRFPKAAKAAMAAGIGRVSAQPPAPGGAADPTPTVTLKDLGATADQKASMAELARLLAKAISEPPKN